ncbi:hypothetical protein Droror1_Dr00017782 [Drosera rotundifolia]
MTEPSKVIHVRNIGHKARTIQRWLISRRSSDGGGAHRHTTTTSVAGSSLFDEDEQHSMEYHLGSVAESLLFDAGFVQSATKVCFRSAAADFVWRLHEILAEEKLFLRCEEQQIDLIALPCVSMENCLVSQWKIA